MQDGFGNAAAAVVLLDRGNGNTSVATIGSAFVTVPTEWLKTVAAALGDNPAAAAVLDAVNSPHTPLTLPHCLPR